MRGRYFDGLKTLKGWILSMEQLMTVKDVAAALKVSVRQVWKLCSCGRLPEPVRVARSVRFRAEDIAAWISQGCPSRDVFKGPMRGEGVKV
jgi:excisionase family DNA binding protein